MPRPGGAARACRAMSQMLPSKLPGIRLKTNENNRFYSFTALASLELLGHARLLYSYSPRVLLCVLSCWCCFHRCECPSNQLTQWFPSSGRHFRRAQALGMGELYPAEASELFKRIAASKSLVSNLGPEVAHDHPRLLKSHLEHYSRPHVWSPLHLPNGRMHWDKPIQTLHIYNIM